MPLLLCCERCGLTFSVRPARRLTARFCSVRCRALTIRRPRKRITKVCEVCGTSFECKPYRHHSARFCSGSCRARWVGSLPHNRRPKPYMIGNKFRLGLSPANAGKPGPRGKDSATWKRISLTCENCGQSFERAPNEIKHKRGYRFCSRTCFKESECFVGSRSSAYLGGPTTVRGLNWRQIRTGVVREQNGQCADCQKLIGNSLHVHHIRPFREFACDAEANVRSNLVGLCNSCHSKADRNFERHNIRLAAEPSLRRRSIQNHQV